MNIYQINDIVNKIYGHMELANKATANKDIYTACKEGRIILKMFYSIDPQDIPNEQLNSYYLAANTMSTFVNSMNRVCN